MPKTKNEMDDLPSVKTDWQAIDLTVSLDDDNHDPLENLEPDTKSKSKNRVIDDDDADDDDVVDDDTNSSDDDDDEGTDPNDFSQETEEDGDDDNDLDDDSENDHRSNKKGSRAQKRIRDLVRKRKELEARIEELSNNQNQGWTDQQRQYQQRIDMLEEANVKMAEQRLDSEEQRLNMLWNQAQLDGDSDKVFQIQKDLGQLQAYRRDLQNYKAARNARGQRAPVRQEAPTTTIQQGTPQTTREQEIRKLPKHAREWFEENEDWFGKDPQLTLAARRAGIDIEMEGEIDVNSKEYWEELSHRVEAFKRGSTGRGNPRKRSPVSGGSRTTNPNRRNDKKITLSAADRELAEEFGMTPQEWYAHKKKSGITD